MKIGVSTSQSISLVLTELVACIFDYLRQWFTMCDMFTCFKQT